MKKNILHSINKRKIFVKSLLLTLFLPLVASASSANKWEDILPTGSTGSGFHELRAELEDKVKGNMGKFFALLGFVGSFIAYIVSHKGSVLFVGIVISLIAGGFVGIVGSFFNVGAAGFEPNSSP